MTQTWIVFSIGDHKVHKISSNCLRSEDMIMATKTMVAIEYKIEEKYVKISFVDEEIQTKSYKNKIVSSRVKEIMSKNIKRKESHN